LSHYPIARFGIHPGELYSFVTNIKQTVIGIDMNVVTGTAFVPVDDFVQRGK
jgi:hypothetical protein